MRHYSPDKEIIRPYDITSWSLPWHRGLKSLEIKVRIEELEKNLEEIKSGFSLRGEIPPSLYAAILAANNNESYKMAFEALKQGLRVDRLDRKEIISRLEIPRGSFYLPFELKLKPLLEKLSFSPWSFPRKSA